MNTNESNNIPSTVLLPEGQSNDIISFMNFVRKGTLVLMTSFMPSLSTISKFGIIGTVLVNTSCGFLDNKVEPTDQAQTTVKDIIVIGEHIKGTLPNGNTISLSGFMGLNVISHPDGTKTISSRINTSDLKKVLGDAFAEIDKNYPNAEIKSIGFGLSSVDSKGKKTSWTSIMEFTNDGIDRTGPIDLNQIPDNTTLTWSELVSLEGFGSSISKQITLPKGGKLELGISILVKDLPNKINGYIDTIGIEITL